MSANPIESSKRDKRLYDILLEYVEGIEQGNVIDRQAFLSRHDEFATELTAFFAGEDQIGALTAPLGGALTDSPRNGNTRLPAAAPSRTFGDYDLLWEIGRGGMGVIYKAKQHGLNRLVAIKMIRDTGLSRGSDRQRFRNEAEAAANLDHPNIVPVYEVGELGGQLFFSMKLIEGHDLAQCLEEVANDPRTAARLMVMIALAVHHAHQRGILHRDLKPSNILIDAQGEPYVTDFGLAKRLRVDNDLTHSGTHVGTPSYMAPEQVAGSGEQVTVAADIHGLGAILYAMLTGRPPFEGDSTFAILDRLREHEPERPSLRNPRVGADLETICLKCLEKNPGSRYGSAEAVAEELKRWLAGEPILARAISRRERVWRWCRRNPAVAALAVAICATVLVALLGLAAGLAVVWNAKEETTTALNRATAEESKARLQLYVAHINLARRTWELANHDRVTEILREYIPRPGEEDLRGFEWYYLWALNHSVKEPEAILRGHAGEVYCVRFSPDGQWLATAGQDKTVRLWDRMTGRQRAVLRGHTDEVNSITFAPDGKTLASAGDDRTIRLWDVQAGRELRQLAHFDCLAVSMAFSKDGASLAVGLDAGKVAILELPLGQVRASTDFPTGRVDEVAFSPDGKTLAAAALDVVFLDFPSLRLKRRLNMGVNSVAFAHRFPLVAVAGKDGFVRFWNPALGEELLAGAAGHGGVVQSVAFSPDDRMMVSSGNDGRLRVWEVPTGKPRDTWVAHGDRIWSVAFSPDGRTLASASRDGTVRLWEPASRSNHHFQLGPRVAERMAFRRDGVGLIAWDQDKDPGCLWDPATGKVVDSVPLNRRAREMGSDLALSPRGDLVAFSEVDGTVQLWDLTRGRQWKSLGPAGKPGCFLVFSADGRRILKQDREGKFTWIWDVFTGNLIGVLEGEETPGAFCPDGKTLVKAGQVGISLWDLDTGRARSGVRVGDRCPVVVSPDGSLIATGTSDMAIVLWDHASAKLRAKLVGHRGLVSSITFSPDGRTLASGGAEGTVLLWNVATGQELLRLEGHTGQIRSIVFSPDGKKLATSARSASSRSGEFILWQAADGPDANNLFEPVDAKTKGVAP